MFKFFEEKLKHRTHLFSGINVPDAVVQELQRGKLKGYDTPKS
jgi:hypothetical protein